MAKKKYTHTKRDIENIVNQIRYRMDELEVSDDVAIYFNGKRYKNIGRWNPKLKCMNPVGFSKRIFILLITANTPLMIISSVSLLRGISMTT